jgi:hypothetical protein
MKYSTKYHRWCAVLSATLLSIVAFLSAEAAKIDFEGLPEGYIIDEISPGQGVTGPLSGVIAVQGFNPIFGLGVNAAIVFDSSCPPGGVPLDCSGNDDDLGTPNETFGGPGVGEAGEAGQEFQNDTPLGNVAIVAENLVGSNTDGIVDDPDDADELGQLIEFSFDDLKHGVATVNDLTYMDVEREQGESGARVELFGPNLPVLGLSIALPPTGDNGVTTQPIGVEGVGLMRVVLNGSGAIEGAVIEEPVEESPCWVTTGGFFNSGVTSGAKQCTFGGNVGPPPSGAFEVNFHSGAYDGSKFHTNEISVVRCEDRGSTGPQQPGGKKGLEVDTLLFECDGRFNNEPGFSCEGYLLDAGEPQGKKNNDRDQISLTVKNSGGDVVAVCEGELDGGNVQIHPPNGGSNR